MSDVEKPDKPTAAPAAAKDEICIVDLGRHTRKRIRRLRKGYGPLMRKVQNATEALQEEGVVESAESQDLG